MLMELIAQEVKAYRSQGLCVLVFSATFQQYFCYTLPVIQIFIENLEINILRLFRMQSNLYHVTYKGNLENGRIRQVIVE